MQDIKVHVVDYGRKFLYMRYLDPVTGKQVSRSSEETTRKAAAKAAAKWEAELQEGRYQSPSKVTWADFRTRYEEEVVPSFADKTADKIDATFNAVEEFVDPGKLMSLDAEQISKFQRKLRDDRKLSESTIKSHLATLKAAMNWAQRQGMIHTVPKFDMPRRAKSGKMMKGRPVSGEEFDRMIEKVAIVVGEPAAESWKCYLRGLWWSGLRLEESLELWWDRDDRLCVDLAGKYPALRIPAEMEKGHQDRLLAIAPEFADILLAVPEVDRTGRVFKLKARAVHGDRLTGFTVSKIISAIGEKAGVKVNTDPRSGKVKYASAHDLRRSFGERWASRVMPQTLMELMRHEAIETTLRYYVGRNSETTAAALRSAMPAPEPKTVEAGNTSSNTPQTSDSQ